MQILFTIDVEFWPVTTDVAVLEKGFARNILGGESGSHGLRYQLDRLAAHGLTGVCFVEALNALAAGPNYLQRMVTLIQEAGHEVQLHLHPEWLSVAEHPTVPHRGPNMKDYSEDEQFILVEAGLEALGHCGADKVTAFRAGNYGADMATLRALRRAGIAYDSSHNYTYLSTNCGLDIGAPLLRPRMLEGVSEIPISHFEDLPGHHRHAQLCATSFGELKAAIAGSAAKEWETFVMVSHGFELLNGARTKANPLLVRRFERLCQYLGKLKEAHPTVGFHELAAFPSSAGEMAEHPLKSNPIRTGLRIGEQVLGRIWG